MKHRLSFIIFLFLCFTFICAGSHRTASATTNKEYVIDGITYELYTDEFYWDWDIPIMPKNKYILSIKELPDIPNVTIPETLTVGKNQATVFNINKKAGNNKTNIKSINLPDTIHYIGADAFSGCSNLESITTCGEDRMPVNLEQISPNAFLNCSSLKKIDFSTNTNIHFSPTSFDGCSVLDLTLPKHDLSVYCDSFSPCVIYTDGIKIRRSTTISADVFETVFGQGISRVDWIVPENNCIDYEIDKKENRLTVTAKETGKVTITAVTPLGLEKTITVTVKDPFFRTYRKGKNITKLSLKKGKTAKIYLQLNPGMGKIKIKKATGKKIAKPRIQGESGIYDLYVKALKKGTSYITLKYYDYEKTLKVKVV